MQPTTKVLSTVMLAVALTAMKTCLAEDLDKPQPPVVLGFAGDSFLVSMPDGTVQMIFSRKTASGMEVARKCTTDNGGSWSEPETLHAMDSKEFGTRLPWATLPLIAKDGRLQLFWMVQRGAESGVPAVDNCIDIWQAHSLESRAAWSPPQRIFEGYVGSINGVTQLESGRIVLPFAYWLAGVPEGPPNGCNATTTVYSDDGGNTWSRSPASLTAPCHADYNGQNFGAIEPTILQLGDGRVWMLIRTQTGRLYESFSMDGTNWSDAKPSPFHSSDSPAWLMRLSDGRIVLFWNNCENTSRVDGQGVYTNRDALHAAISSDEGRTWRGYREVYLDPLRDQSPPKFGDRGTAYPYPTATKDGKILMVTGQGEGRRNLLLVDPTWLEETYAEDNFSHGLDGWSVFKSFGPAANWWRDRVQGAELVDHPTKPGAKALHIRRPDEKDGDEAVWNFPFGRQGNLAVKLLLKPGCQGVRLALADRHIQPNDDVGEKMAVFLLPIAADGSLPDGAVLKPNQWYTIGLHWDLDKHRCQVLLDGQPVGSLATLSEDCLGLSYLRLCSTATTTDGAGMLIESVHADVGHQ